MTQAERVAKMLAPHVKEAQAAELREARLGTARRVLLRTHSFSRAYPSILAVYIPLALSFLASASQCA
jgi:hypothetical protein